MKFNQYFITNDARMIRDDADFNEYNVDNFKIFTHKNLKTNCFSRIKKNLVIVGDIFNPYAPDSSNRQIGDKLIEANTLDEILQGADKLTGRFIMLITIKGSHYVLSDFFGQRQVYYYFYQDLFYASSSDKLLLELLNLELKIDNVKEQLSTSNYFLKIHEHWLLGETDWDNRLKKLLPNHYITIGEATTIRLPIYAKKTYNKGGLETEILNVLNNTISAYSKRYSLMLGLTSGYDSRLLLASSIALKNTIKYFTFRRKDTYVKRDLTIAKQLAKVYQLNHETIEASALSPEFISEFEAQFLIPRLLDKTKNIQWFKNQKFQNAAIISGNGGALIRSIYNEKDFKTSASICKAIEYEPCDLHLNELDQWLHNTKEYAIENNLLISDLFYLEVRLGKWGNKMVHEMDISGVEEFTPYNNRDLMYSILLNYNKVERQTITLNLLEQSLKGITKIPFNPKTWKDKIKNVIFYEYYKKWFQRIK